MVLKIDRLWGGGRYMFLYNMNIHVHMFLFVTENAMTPLLAGKDTEAIMGKCSEQKNIWHQVT